MTNAAGTLGSPPPSMDERAGWLADAGGLNAVIDAGRFGEPTGLPLAAGRRRRVSMAAKPLSVWPICHTVSLCPAISQVIPAYTA